MGAMLFHAMRQPCTVAHGKGGRHALAAAGWGLDHVWPFLLRYPLRQIAVIDDVCMWHPTHRANKQGSLYDVEAPYECVRPHSCAWPAC